MGCRFEMTITGKGEFHCAAKFGANGWAYLWEHGDFDPCVDCLIKIDGKPTTIGHELRPAEFMERAGELIRYKDWQEIKKRGYDIDSNGYHKIGE